MVNNRQLLEMRIITRSNILSGLKARRRSPSCFRHDKTTLHASVLKNEPLGVSNNSVNTFNFETMGLTVSSFGENLHVIVFTDKK